MSSLLIQMKQILQRSELTNLAPIVMESPQLGCWLSFEVQQARTCNGKRDGFIL